MRLDHIYATYDWRENRGVEKFKYCPLCGTSFAQAQIAQKTRPLCPNCGFVFYRNPYPTVSILLIHDNKVLLGKRSAEPGQGKWALPSGYIEFEDDFLTAAIREVKEETGVTIEILSILNVQSAFLPPEYHYLTIYLLARPTGGRLHPQDDLADVNWFSLSEPLPDLAFPPDVQLIQTYSTGRIKGITIKKKRPPLTR
jgi:ADP-ribose pyrophosphatase YjhB (NUDIX family)